MRAAIKRTSRMSFPIFNGFPPKNVCWDIRQRPTPDPPSEGRFTRISRKLLKL